MPSRTRIANAIGFAKFFGRSHNAVTRVFDEAGNVIETTNPPIWLVPVEKACFKGEAMVSSYAEPLPEKGRTGGINSRRIVVRSHPSRISLLLFVRVRFMFILQYASLTVGRLS